MDDKIKAAYIMYTRDAEESNTSTLFRVADLLGKSRETMLSYRIADRMRIMFSPNPAEAKSKLRLECKAINKQHEAHFLLESETICSELADYITHCFKDVKVVGLYKATKQEVDTTHLYDVLVSRNIKVAYPKIENDELNFYTVNSLNDFEVKSYGVPEPISDEYVNPDELKVIIVPGVAFDKTNGNRLGHGKGHYDKFFAKNQEAYRVGLTLDNLLCQIPKEEFDVSMHMVLTEHMHYFSDPNLVPSAEWLNSKRG